MNVNYHQDYAAAIAKYTAEVHYAFRFQFQFPEDEKPSYETFFSTNFHFPEDNETEIREHLGAYGDEDIHLDEVGFCENTFDDGSILSYELISILNKVYYQNRIIDNSPKVDDLNLKTEYLTEIFYNLSDTNKLVFQRDIVNAILDNIKAKGINKEVIKAILSRIELPFYENIGIITQLKNLLRPVDDLSPLLKLVTPKEAKMLAKQLTMLNEEFCLTFEMLKIKVAIVLYVFASRSYIVSETIGRKGQKQPKFAYNAFIKAFCEYLRIDTPTVKPKKIKEYKDSEDIPPLYAKLMKERSAFWDKISSSLF